MYLKLKNDHTQSKLIEFCRETEDIFNHVLRQFDKSSKCAIHTSLDLGLPHDLIRIAGGFPTGSIVDWKCSTPFIPVDTTVNVCTGSIFEISNIDYDILTEAYFQEFNKKMDMSSYILNFNRGNHFIVFAKSENTGKNYLILHSSAAEFKKQYNGLYPVKGNWYYDDIKTFNKGNRYLRYLVGKKAETFFSIAKQVETYNELRQDFMAHTLIGYNGTISSSKHYHHYYMPNESSVVIGSYLGKDEEKFPIFTSLGKPIFMFKVKACLNNKIFFGNEERYIIPHGWGKKSSVCPDIQINVIENIFSLNGVEQSIDIESSLRNHPNLEIREFSTNINDENYFFNVVKNQLFGDVVDKYCQLISYTKHGVSKW